MSRRKQKVSDSKKICEQVRRVREHLGWNQQQMAEALGYSRNYVSMLEGGREPGANFVREWTEFLAARGLSNEQESEQAKEEPAYYGSPRERLNDALDRADMTPAQLAKAIGYDAGIITNVVRGGGKISEAMAEKIVAALDHGLTVEDLLAGSDQPQVLSEDGLAGTHGAKPRVALPPGMKGRMVPLLSMAQAGGWDACHTDEGWNGDSVFALNVDDRQSFAIRVAGNSMEPEIMEGDVVICSPREPMTNGCCAVVRTKSEQAFIKFWRQRGDKVTLESANPAYQPIQFPLVEIAGAWPVVQRIASGKITKQVP